jgi:MoaA/NifB/PqqE/SkfB family radical SAM enzyme
MEKLRAREHDFGSKLRQRSAITRLRDYVSWQRRQRAVPGRDVPPSFGPLSINLDLASACNFACPHCVDSTIINRRHHLRLEDVKKTVALLQSRGLLSVILLGGGEPTLHPDVEEIVKYLKTKKLQVGIVTNGSRLEKIAGAVPLLQEKDWVRVSIDAARERTFQELHRPKIGITLEKILKKARHVKEINSSVSLGYSFVIVWKGVDANGVTLKSNVDEMAHAVELGGDYGFDYVSFKPCLIRLKESQRESLLDDVDKDEEEVIVRQIRSNMDKARQAARGKTKILESVNLTALLNREADQIKRQPKRCHMQFFRTVVTPGGIFHCPAFRGIEKAKIAEDDGYTNKRMFEKSMKSTAHSLLTFDAEEECKVVGCFYHDTNWWLEHMIRSRRDVNEIPMVEDDNFFL